MGSFSPDDVVFVINLDRHRARYPDVCKEIELLGFSKSNIYRVPGVLINDGKTEGDRVRGCAEAQLECMRQGLELGLSRILIVEDDMVVDRDWLSTWPNIQKELRRLPAEEWDLLYLGYRKNKKRRKNMDIAVPGYQHMRQNLRPYCTHCYYVNLDYYSELVKMRSTWMEEGLAIDELYCALSAQGRLRARGVFPRIALQKSGVSFIKQTLVDHNSLLKDTKDSVIKETYLQTLPKRQNTDDYIYQVSLPLTATASICQAIRLLELPMQHRYFKFGLSHLVPNTPKFTRPFPSGSGTPYWLVFDKLSRAVPNAKYIYVDRSPESWVDSALNKGLITQYDEMYRRFCNPSLCSKKDLKQLINDYCFLCFFGHNPCINDRLFLKRKFEEHRAKVFATIPRDQLLVLPIERLSWDPICSFLDKPIPDLPFPTVKVGRRSK